MGELPPAVIRRTPADFRVDEIPAYPALGQGEHLFVTFRKTGWTTLDAVKAIGRALDVDPRGIGYAGLKDRHAITTQTASFQVPLAREIRAEELQRAAPPGIEILSAARHPNKLKPGHLLGNRFTLTLRDVPAESAAGLAERLRALARTGVPNAFGPQRFGQGGENPARAFDWIAGRARGPRDRHAQRLLFSSLQSLLYNRVLERRVADGTWAAVLPGDLAKKHDSGGLFLVSASGPELEDAQARAAAGALSATGPMFGAKMRWPEGAPGALEREVLQEALGGGIELLAPWKALGEGTRRPLRMAVAELVVGEEPAPALAQQEVERREARDPGAARPGTALVVSFVLPKGGYATTVLGQVCRVVDATREGPSEAELPNDPSLDMAPSGVG